MMRTVSPAAIVCWVALRTWRTAPSGEVISTPLTAPSVPPQRPHGGVTLRSRLKVMNAGVEELVHALDPEAARGSRPAPPESWRSP